ncbi:MAG: P-loop NTPase, partial [candidate division Zixibacteria bacterium]|nr:P-loop NTPase [candidate division Zixibacteria bacterium]
MTNIDQNLLEFLKPVKDPELRFSIVKLGMVSSLTRQNGTINLSLKLPLPNSPSEAELKNEIRSALSDLEGVTGVEISTTVMSDEERLDLANKIHGRPSTGGSDAKGGSGLSVDFQPAQIDEKGNILETDAHRRAVLEILATIDDPEINKPLTELGMVKALGIESGNVGVEILLTVPGCPLKDKITSDIANGLKTLDWVKNVAVDFDVMTEQQRQRVAEIVQGNEPDAWKGRKPVSAGEYAKRIIVVASGKGGVGKSTTTTNLAFALAEQGYEVGILDADVYGFSIPRMTGVFGRPRVVNEMMEPIRKGRVQVMSMGYFVDEDAAVIWRGPLLHKAINQFITDVLWEKMDYLFIDLPPGTGDVTLTLATALPQSEMLIVTTPQPVATHVAGRVARLAE